MGAWEELVAGQLFNSVITPFTSIIGAELFYLMIWISVLGILMIRTRSWGLVVMAIMITSFAFVPHIFPQAQKWILVFCIGGFIYILQEVIFKNK